MRRAATIAVALAVGLLGACRSKADDARAQYAIVSKDGTLGEQCSKAREVRDAYLAAHDGGNYQHWQGTAGRDCLEAELHGEEAPADTAAREAAESQAAEIAANGEAAAANIITQAQAAAAKDNKPAD